MALLGVYVSLKPQPREKHMLFIALFVLLFVGGGAVNITQTRLAANAQAGLVSQLNKIQKNTEQPPQINVQPPQVNVPPPIIVPNNKQHVYMSFLEPEVKHDMNSQLRVFLVCINKSLIPAQNVFCATAFLARSGASGYSKDEQDKAYGDFIKHFRPAPRDQRHTIGIGEFARTFSEGGPVLTQDIEDKMENTNSSMLVLGVLFFKDDFGEHEMEYCRWSNAPLKVNPAWQLCVGHDGIIH